MAVEVFDIRPEDGWTAVTSGNIAFIKIRSNSPKHPFYVTADSSLPAATDPGYKVDCYMDEFWVDVAATGLTYYVRTTEATPAGSRISVFSIAATP